MLLVTVLRLAASPSFGVPGDGGEPELTGFAGAKVTELLLPACLPEGESEKSTFATESTPLGDVVFELLS